MGGLDLLIPILFIVPTSLLASAIILRTTSSSALIRHGASTISPCTIFIYSSGTSISSDIATSKATSHSYFFEEQLDVCKQLITDHEKLQQFSEDGGVENNIRTRFKEHPRCTARFGEVPRHARNRAVSINEY